MQGIQKVNCHLIHKEPNHGNLYLGNVNSIEEDNLINLQIKAVITAARGVNITLKNVNHFIIEADDDDNYQIIQHFQKAIKFIEQNILKGNVLVHCFAGVSRSATIVAAYIMKTQKQNCNQVIQIMQSIRPQVKPNPGFINQLKQFEKKVL